MVIKILKNAQVTPYSLWRLVFFCSVNLLGHNKISTFVENI